MENGPFIDGLPIKNGDFLWLCYITKGYLFLGLYQKYKSLPNMDPDNVGNMEKVEGL